MKNTQRVGAAVTLAALIGIITLALSGGAQAATCGQAAVYKTVTTAATPAVYGPDVKVIDTPGHPVIPGEPAVPEVSHVDHRLVTPSLWWNWSPNKDQGPFDGPPAFPVDERGTWEGSHSEGGPGQDQTGTFQQGNGNGSWFHREAAVYEDVKVIDTPAKDATPDVPAVDEVSHIVKGALITPAKSATSKKVLVTAATKACAVKAVPTKRAPAEELAFTGSATAPLSGIAGLLLATAAGAYMLRRRLS